MALLPKTIFHGRIVMFLFTVLGLLFIFFNTKDLFTAVAVSGRVPVRVTGTVTKGDRLVSAGNGIARSALEGEANYFNCIGRALKDKNTSETGTVEAFVIIN